MRSPNSLQVEKHLHSSLLQFCIFGPRVFFSLLGHLQYNNASKTFPPLASIATTTKKSLDPAACTSSCRAHTFSQTVHNFWSMKESNAMNVTTSQKLPGALVNPKPLPSFSASHPKGFPAPVRGLGHMSAMIVKLIVPLLRIFWVDTALITSYQWALYTLGWEGQGTALHKATTVNRQLPSEQACWCCACPRTCLHNLVYNYTVIHCYTHFVSKTSNILSMY